MNSFDSLNLAFRDLFIYFSNMDSHTLFKSKMLKHYEAISHFKHYEAISHSKHFELVLDFKYFKLVLDFEIVLNFLLFWAPP
jgi:hypothetical protein